MLWECSCSYGCYAIASDRRLGVHLQTIAADFQRIYKMHHNLFIGLSVLAIDSRTLLGPYFCQPLIAGLSDEDKPFICTMDSIGAKLELHESLCVAFVNQCSSLTWYVIMLCLHHLGTDRKPFDEDLPRHMVQEPEELFEAISQALLSSRKTFFSYNAQKRILKGRME